MIRLTLRLTGDQITGFDCVGHAGFAQAGRDIVCAAVSILTTTCVNALESVAKVTPKVQVEDGKMLVSLPDSAGHDAQVILRAMRQGLRDLAEEYPRYFQLIEP